MSEQQKQGGFVIFLSILLAIMVSMIDLPDSIVEFKPYWLLLVLIYWCIALPNRVGIGIAWTSGLVLDVAYNTILGQQALVMAVIVYFTLQIHQRLRIFPLLQQSITVFILAILYAIFDLWIRGIIGEPVVIWAAISPAITSALFWPPIFLLLRHVRRTFRVK